MKKFFITIFFLSITLSPSIANEIEDPLKNLKEPTNEAEVQEFKNTLLTYHESRYKLVMKRIESVNDQFIKNKKCGSVTRCKKKKELIDLYKSKMTDEYNKNVEQIDKIVQSMLKTFSK
jgi:hypothetical protein